MDSLGQRIRQAREGAGLSQEQLAARIGVSVRTVGNWERGAHVPRDRVDRLLAALGPLGDDIVVSPSDQGGVLLDLPASALEGLSEDARLEVITRAKAAALQAAREIRNTDG